jgi:ATP-dependent Clp protease adaptor protein ClpS
MAMGNGKEKYDQQTEEKTEIRTGKPSLYNVFLLNDDYTTMDFVVHILERIFQKNRTEATQIMLHVHKQGMGLAGVYPREIAETKVETVHRMARENEYPLKCIMEKKND